LPADGVHVPGLNSGGADDDGDGGDDEDDMPLPDGIAEAIEKLTVGGDDE
jgi:hypothetical protein